MGCGVIQTVLIGIFAGCLMGCGMNGVFKPKSTQSEESIIPDVLPPNAPMRPRVDTAPVPPIIDRPPIEKTVSLAPQPKVIVIEKATEVTELMDFYDKLSQYSVKEVTSESREIKKRYDKKQKPLDGLKYALTLICCSKSYSEEMIALDVVHSLKAELKASEDVTLDGFIQFLSSILIKRIYASALNQALYNQFAAKDEYIKHLEKQISALKSIEKSIHERELGAD